MTTIMYALDLVKYAKNLNETKLKKALVNMPSYL